MADPKDTLDPEPVDAEFEPADDSRGTTRRPAWFGLASLLGIVVIAAVAAAAIYLSGVFRPEPVTPAQPGPATAERTALTDTVASLETRLAALEASRPDAGEDGRLAALELRIARMEERPATAAGNSDLEARLEALETAPAASADSDYLTALSRRLDRLEDTAERLDALVDQALDAAQAGGGGAVDPQLLDDITARLATLESASGPSTAGEADPRIDRLGERIVALEADLAQMRDLARDTRSAVDTAANLGAQNSTASEDAAAARRLAARALALTSLRDSAATGEGFEPERAALARLWRDNPDLAAMSEYARAGVPTLDDLADTYPGDAIRDAAGPGRIFFGLIEVRQVDPDRSQTGPLALTALAEEQLARGDLAGAVSFTERLDGSALETARDWLIAARARLDLDVRLGRLRQALAETAAELGEDPS